VQEIEQCGRECLRTRGRADSIAKRHLSIDNSRLVRDPMLLASEAI